jgi:hypothetical protein
MSGPQNERRLGDTWYSKEHGSYYFYRQGLTGATIQFMADEVALLFEANEGFLVKHGPVEMVNKQRTRLEHGPGPFTLRMISGREWDVDVLNRIVQTSGGVLHFLEKMPGFQEALESALEANPSRGRLAGPR